VPRWADEGGAVLSEDEPERNRHDSICRQILNTPGRAMPLRRLFALREYPSDVMSLYAQGYSVANFLVGATSRPAFLAFVAHGMQYGWDSAAQVHYRYQSVEELEQAWLNHLRNTRRPPVQFAKNTNAPESQTGQQQVVVRQTVPPVQPFDPPPPIVRGANPEGERRAIVPAAAAAASGRPGYLPDYGQPVQPPSVGLSPPVGWSPMQPPGATHTPPAVHLGAPQFGPGR
jgi:hypothetical protein